MSFFNKYKKVNVPLCSKCGLGEQCLSPNISLSGDGEKGVLIIAEASGVEEDEKGTQLIGEAGQYLRKVLKKNKLKLDKDFWKIDAVSCRPIKRTRLKNGKISLSNRKPTKKELEYCWPNVEKAIKTKKPKIIWLLGSTAVETFYRGRQTKTSVSKFRGYKIYDSIHNCWVFATVHPSYVINNKGNEFISSVFKQDIKNMVGELGLKRPKYNNPLDYLHLLTEYKSVITFLKKIIKEKPVIGFDYETTGLKPYAEGHKIASVAIATSSTNCCAFPIDYPHWSFTQRDKIVKLFKKILVDRKIKKVLQNAGFEDIWSRVIFGVSSIQNIIWDTMNTTHILDERPDITGLKFQLFRRYGIEKYNSEVEGKLKSDGSSNGFNRVMEIPLLKLLGYNGIDALGTRWLWVDQKVEIGKRKLKFPNNFFLDGMKAFTNSQYDGILTDTEFYNNQWEILGNTIEEKKRKILNSKAAKKFKKKTGKIFSITGSDDLKELFYDILGYEPIKYTKIGNPSLDEEALTKLNSKLAKLIVDYKKIDKLKGTYLKALMNEPINGLLHCFFNLHIARSFRSSSSRLNWQNIPSRDPYSVQVTRGGIIPRPGHRLIDADFGGIEVCMAGCYTQDPTLIQYLKNPLTDMHRDSAIKLFKLQKIEKYINWDDKKTGNAIRFTGKNGWVFAQFYGSYFKSCARNIYQTIPSLNILPDQTMEEHLDSIGLGTYNALEDHFKKVEKWFWDRFPVFKKWQKKVLTHYLKTGEVQTMFGFVRRGMLNQNKVINTPFQASAFHCLLWSYIQLQKTIKDKGWYSILLGQIHDAIVGDIPSNETNKYIRTMNQIMTKDIRKVFPWIIVPLEVEIEMTKINESWDTKKKVPITDYT